EIPIWSRRFAWWSAGCVLHRLQSLGAVVTYLSRKFPKDVGIRAPFRLGLPQVNSSDAEDLPMLNPLIQYELDMAHHYQGQLRRKAALWHLADQAARYARGHQFAGEGTVPRAL